MVKLDTKNEGKASKSSFLNALSNDPEWTQYFKGLGGLFAKAAIYLTPRT